MLGKSVGLGYQGKDFPEFQEFCDYVKQAQEQARLENLPHEAQDLLEIMQSDIWKFNRMTCRSNSPTGDVSENRYYDIPILKYIEPSVFVEKLLRMTFDQKRTVSWSLNERYNNCNPTLIEELDWLKSVRNLLLEEANRKTGKISGYNLKLLIETYFDEAIEKLEAAKTE